MTAYEDLQFGPIAEGSPVEAALLWGNPETGPAAVLVRFPEGFAEPLHSHSSTYHSVLVKGSFSSRGLDGTAFGNRAELQVLVGGHCFLCHRYHIGPTATRFWATIWLSAMSMTAIA